MAAVPPMPPLKGSNSMSDNHDALSRVYAAAYTAAKAEEKSDGWARTSGKRACVDFQHVASGEWEDPNSPES